MSASSYLIVSDLHLMDVEDHEDGWKRYKSPRYHIDEQFDELVEKWVREAPEEARLTLVLNGDIFDFDLVAEVPESPPWPIARHERQCGLDPSEAKSIYKMGRMVADHPIFIRTLARLRTRGHGVVYTYGNHDRELHFDAVKDVLRDAITETAAELGERLDPVETVVFEPWFFFVPDEVYAEHGNQYDRYSSFRYVLSPVYEDKAGNELIAVPMGDLSCRYLLNRMGFFNPHANDFMLSFFAYVAHWARHYAGKGRSLIRSWAFGSLLVMVHAFRTRRRVSKHGPEPHLAERRALADRTGLETRVLEAIDDGKRVPVTLRPFRLIRELWLDRVAIAAGMTGSTVALALLPLPLWIQLMVPLAVFPLIFLAYEAMAQESIWKDYEMVPARAQRIALLTGARVVATGHTHDPMLVPLAHGRSFVNTGTWALDHYDEENVLGKRNYALVTVCDGEVDVRLDSWTEAPAAVSAPEAVAADERRVEAAAPIPAQVV